jgi:hypothetical protein
VEAPILVTNAVSVEHATPTEEKEPEHDFETNEVNVGNAPPNTVGTVLQQPSFEVAASTASSAQFALDTEEVVPQQASSIANTAPAASAASQPLVILQGFATRLAKLINADEDVISRSKFLSKIKHKQDQWYREAGQSTGVKIPLIDLADICFGEVVLNSSVAIPATTLLLSQRTFATPTGDVSSDMWVGYLLQVQVQAAQFNAIVLVIESGISKYFHVQRSVNGILTVQQVTSVPIIALADPGDGCKLNVFSPIFASLVHVSDLDQDSHFDAHFHTSILHV